DDVAVLTLAAVAGPTTRAAAGAVPALRRDGPARLRDGRRSQHDHPRLERRRADDLAHAGRRAGQARLVRETRPLARPPLRGLRPGHVSVLRGGALARISRRPPEPQSPP